MGAQEGEILRRHRQMPVIPRHVEAAGAKGARDIGRVDAAVHVEVNVGAFAPGVPVDHDPRLAHAGAAHEQELPLDPNGLRKCWLFKHGAGQDPVDQCGQVVERQAFEWKKDGCRVERRDERLGDLRAADLRRHA
ncbi:MAG: hypothetical protein E5Y59_06540, partial [Mesorhizobium sp.]